MRKISKIIRKGAVPAATLWTDNDTRSAKTSGRRVPLMTPICWQRALAEHDRWLRTVVLARVGQASAVDEVMQDVALAAVRQQAPLREAEKVAPWLYRLAVTQALLYRRRQGRQRKLTNRYVERVAPSEQDARATDPLAWLLAGERAEQLRQAMQQMPRGEVEILFLKYTEGWSYQQMAEHLGTTTSAIESRLHRARGRLRRALATYEEVHVE